MQQEDVSYCAFNISQPYPQGWDLSLCPSPAEANEDCPLVSGCTSTGASNYDSQATIEDGSCIFSTFSGLLINEYSATNCDNDGSDCGDYEDWIELYNNSSDPIDLAGYFLSDRITNVYKWEFPSSFVIAPLSLIHI